MSWKDLDIKLKAELIKLGILSGITDKNKIIQMYDLSVGLPTLVRKFEEGELVNPTLEEEEQTTGLDRLIQDYQVQDPTVLFGIKTLEDSYKVSEAIRKYLLAKLAVEKEEEDIIKNDVESFINKNTFASSKPAVVPIMSSGTLYSQNSNEVLKLLEITLLLLQEDTKNENNSNVENKLNKDVIIEEGLLFNWNKDSYPKKNSWELVTEIAKPNIEEYQKSVQEKLKKQKDLEEQQRKIQELIRLDSIQKNVLDSLTKELKPNTVEALSNPVEVDKNTIQEIQDIITPKLEKGTSEYYADSTAKHINRVLDEHFLQNPTLYSLLTDNFNFNKIQESFIHKDVNKESHRQPTDDSYIKGRQPLEHQHRAIIIHSSAGTPNGDLKSLAGKERSRDPKTGELLYNEDRTPKFRLAGAHFYISQDGKIYLLVGEDKVAFHSSVGLMFDAVDPNSFAFGIELEGYSYEEGKYNEHKNTDFSKNPKLLESLGKVIAYLCNKYNIPYELIQTHYDVDDYYELNFYKNLGFLKGIEGRKDLHGIEWKPPRDKVDIMPKQYAPIKNYLETYVFKKINNEHAYGGYINNQQPVLFRLFNMGGYISNNPTLALVGKVRKYAPGGYTDNQPISYKTWKDYENLENINQRVLEGLAMLQYADNKATYGDNVPEEAKYLYDLGLLPEVEVTASRKLNKKEQYLADLQWRDYLKQHPIQIGSEEYNRLPEKAKAQVFKNSVTDAIGKAALPTAAAIIAPTALSAAGASAIPLIEGVAADWATLGPILKETGKSMLVSELGYQTVSKTYELGTNGRDLLTDTGNALFPFIENQTVKDVLSAMANPGGWLGIPGQAVANSFKGVAKPLFTRMITGDAYTTLGGKFGYYGNTLKERVINTIKRRLGLKTDPSHPEFLRKIDAEHLIVNKDGDIDILAGQRPDREFINFSTDRPVVSHTGGDWDYMPELIINPTEFKSHTPISIEPSDTFFRRPQNMTANPKNTTLVSGNIEELNKAKSLGMETLSSRKLRRLYKKMAESSKDGKPNRRSSYRKEYTKEIQRLTNKRGTPDINDYKYMEELYGLKSGVVPIEDVDISKLIDWYKQGLLVKYPNNSLLQRHDPGYILKRDYNKVFYDPASSIEYDYKKKMSVPQLYSDLHTLGFKNGGFLFPNLAFSHKFGGGGFPDGKSTLTQNDSNKKVSKTYFENFPNLLEVYGTPRYNGEEKEMIENGDITGALESRNLRGEEEVQKVKRLLNNLTLLDSMFYTPILQRVDNIFEKTYNPDEEVSAMHRVSEGKVLGSLKDALQYYPVEEFKKKHQYILNKLLEVSDEDIYKFMTTNWGMETVLDIMNIKPKNLSLAELLIIATTINGMENSHAPFKHKHGGYIFPKGVFLHKFDDGGYTDTAATTTLDYEPNLNMNSIDNDDNPRGKKNRNIEKEVVDTSLESLDFFNTLTLKPSLGAVVTNGVKHDDYYVYTLPILSNKVIKATDPNTGDLVRTVYRKKPFDKKSLFDMESDEYQVQPSIDKSLLKTINELKTNAENAVLTLGDVTDYETPQLYNQALKDAKKAVDKYNALAEKINLGIINPEIGYIDNWFLKEFASKYLRENKDAKKEDVPSYKDTENGWKLDDALSEVIKYAQLKESEGTIPTPYYDTLGVLTVGRGTTNNAGIKFNLNKMDRRLSDIEMGLLEQLTVNGKIKAIKKHLNTFNDLSDAAKGILVNAAYRGSDYAKILQMYNGGEKSIKNRINEIYNKVSWKDNLDNHKPVNLEAFTEAFINYYNTLDDNKKILLLSLIPKTEDGTDKTSVTKGMINRYNNLFNSDSPFSEDEKQIKDKFYELLKTEKNKSTDRS